MPGFLGAIRKVPIAGGPWTELSPATSYGVLVDATSVYWTSFQDGSDGGTAVVGGSVFQMTPK